MCKFTEWIVTIALVGTTIVMSGCSGNEMTQDQMENVIGFGIIVGLILVGVLIWGVAVLKEWYGSWRHYRRTLSKIRAVTDSGAQAALQVPERGTVSIDQAVRDRQVKLSSVKGDGLENVRVCLEPAKAGTSHRVSFPIGLVFLLDGGHQNMSIRETRVETIEKPSECRIPATCINFHKSVPTAHDAFHGFGQVNPVARNVLAVAKVADVGGFVTQLATWIVTDDIDPSIVAIGRMFDSKKRTADKWEKLIAHAIAAKARELSLS